MSHICTENRPFQPVLLTTSAIETDIARQEAAESIIFFAVAHVFGYKPGYELIDRLERQRTAIRRRAGIILRAKTTEGVLDRTPRWPLAPAGKEGGVREGHAAIVLLILGQLGEGAVLVGIGQIVGGRREEKVRRSDHGLDAQDGH